MSDKLEKYYFGVTNYSTCTENCNVVKEVMIGSVGCWDNCEFCINHDKEDSPEWIICSRIEEAKGK